MTKTATFTIPFNGSVPCEFDKTTLKDPCATFPTRTTGIPEEPEYPAILPITTLLTVELGLFTVKVLDKPLAKVEVKSVITADPSVIVTAVGKINSLAGVQHSNITNMITTSIISVATLPIQIPTIIRRYTRNIDPKDDNDLL